MNGRPRWGVDKERRRDTECGERHIVDGGSTSASAKREEKTNMHTKGKREEKHTQNYRITMIP